MDKKINGNIAGIRNNILEEMLSLYTLEQPSGIFLSRDLSESLASYTERIGRENNR